MARTWSNEKLVFRGSSQKPPFIKPLPYYAHIDSGEGSYGFRSFWNDMRGWSCHAAANNSALDKMTDISDQAADLLVAFRERQKTIDMVQDGLTSLVKVARAIRKKDPVLLRKVVYGKSKAETKMILSRPANIWLAYHFGIVPTVMDIHHACGVLAKDAPVLDVQATGVSRESFDFSGYDYDWNRSGDAFCAVKLGGEITNVNRNKMLIGQLGFTSPLSMVWEMTPFSWFVDYFVNVGDILSNFEPRFPGIEFANQYTTRYSRGNFKCFYKQYITPAWRYVNSSNGIWERDADYYEGEHIEIERTLGWPDYMLTTSLTAQLSIQRCSYIAAVLVSILSGFKK